MQFYQLPLLILGIHVLMFMIISNFISIKVYLEYNINASLLASFYHNKLLV